MKGPIIANANGNTFLIFDCIDSRFNYLSMLFWFVAKKVDSCLVIHEHSKNDDTLNVKMDVYFPKGGFCGNGTRAIAHYLHANYTHKSYNIITDAATIKLSKMFLNRQLAYSASLYLPTDMRSVIISGYKFYELNVVSEPHLITFDNIKTTDLAQLGKMMQTTRSINLSRCIITQADRIFVVTWERGIERFTKSCGTAIVASYYAARRLNKIDGNTCIAGCAGGILRIIKNHSDRVELIGDTTVQNKN